MFTDSNIVKLLSYLAVANGTLISRFVLLRRHLTCLCRTLLVICNHMPRVRVR